jgi:hypothetical protein
MTVTPVLRRDRTIRVKRLVISPALCLIAISALSSCSSMEKQEVDWVRACGGIFKSSEDNKRKGDKYPSVATIEDYEDGAAAISVKGRGGSELKDLEDWEIDRHEATVCEFEGLRNGDGGEAHFKLSYRRLANRTVAAGDKRSGDPDVAVYGKEDGYYIRIDQVTFSRAWIYFNCESKGRDVDVFRGSVEKENLKMHDRIHLGQFLLNSADRVYRSMRCSNPVTFAPVRSLEGPLRP